MKSSIQVLLVSATSSEADQIASAIQKKGKSIISRASSVNEAIQGLKNNSIGLLVCDSSLNQDDSLKLLHYLRGEKPDVPFVYLAASSDDPFSEHIMKQGAYECITKKQNYLSEISVQIPSIYERHTSALTHGHLKEDGGKPAPLVAEHKIFPSSVRDELTGVFNHRYFQQELYSEFLRARRYGYPLSCVMIDIDYFKNINDTKGYSIGDEVLKELAYTLTTFAKSAGVIARHGGEEFVILLPHLGYEDAIHMADKLREIIGNKTFLTGQYSGQYNLKVTISAGVSSYPDDPIQEYDDLTTFAGKALFRAKGKKGRNSVSSYSSMIRELEAKIPALQFSLDKTTEFRRRLIDISETAKRTYIESTKTLVYALEAKDKYTLGHAARVAQYSAMVAREMGLEEDDVTTIEHAGLLHDVGKVCISDEILLKPGAFTNVEYEKMKQHPQLGYQIIKPIKFLTEEALIILHHHEWYNGKGYPHRLKGKEIPIGARIVSMLDAYDTMRAAGARYKKTMTIEEIVSELINGCGTQFDPEVTAAMIRVLVKRGELEEGSYDKQRLEQAVKQAATV